MIKYLGTLCVCNQIGLEKNLWSRFSPATNWWKDRRVNVKLFGSALFVMIHEPYYNAVFWYVQSFPCFIHNVSKEIVSVQHMLKKNFWMNIFWKNNWNNFNENTFKLVSNSPLSSLVFCTSKDYEFPSVLLFSFSVKQMKSTDFSNPLLIVSWFTLVGMWSK